MISALKNRKTMQETIDAILGDSCQLTGSKLSYFAILNPDEDVLTMVGWSKSAMAECRMIAKPIVYLVEETGMWSDPLRERKSIITNDYKNLKKPTKKGYPTGHVDLVRHLGVPVFQGQKIVAILGVGNKATNYLETDAKQLTDYMTDAWKILQPRIPANF